MGFQYAVAQALPLKGHSLLNEKWLQDRIKDDPSILGLGDLEVKDVERILPKAGRLDMLLVDPETAKRYEVELMLGATDESHIIRCLEYWDIERRRYPQYDHCAVLVAEDITSRFLNVISLFNGCLPVIAIKLSALQIDDKVVLQFVKVMDEFERCDDDEGGYEPPATRQDWETKSSKKSMEVADASLAILRKLHPKAEFKYNRNYMGVSIDGLVRNRVVFRPKREFVRLTAKLGQQQTWADRLEDAGLAVLEGGRSRGRLTFRLAPGEAQQHHEVLLDLFKEAYGDVEAN